MNLDGNCFNMLPVNIKQKSVCPEFLLVLSVSAKNWHSFPREEMAGQAWPGTPIKHVGPMMKGTGTRRLEDVNSPNH